MFVAQVTGSVVATQKTATMTGHKMLIVEPYRLDEKTRDRLVPTGRTFVAEYPCLIRKYLFFGYGNIEVRSAGGMQKDVISGVIFAEYFARRLVRDHLIHGNTRHVEMESLLEEEAESESGANSATFTPHLESSN